MDLLDEKEYYIAYFDLLGYKNFHMSKIFKINRG